MTSNFSAIGLPIASEEEMYALVNRVGPLAEELTAPSGAYFRWSDPSGAELWLQVNADNQLIGMNPHYAGRSAVRVGLTDRLPSVGPSELDGAFHGWADPAGDEPDTGCYPFVFDAPDYRLREALSLPAVTEVQIAAFAHEIAAFETVAAYEASQTGDLKFGSQSFIPSGLFTLGGESTAPPKAAALFAGALWAVDAKIRVLSGQAFYCALVETLGWADAVVISATLLSGVPAVGGVISGSFWLSGRIVGR